MQGWYLPELSLLSMCGGNGAAIFDALSGIAVLVPSVCRYGLLRHLVCVTPPPTTTPCTPSLVWSECLTEDKAERAASVAHLDGASAMCRACG